MTEPPRPVLIEHDTGVTTLTLNRPERRNAIDATMVHALMDALGQADAFEGSGAIVLAGAGRAFSSGGDVANMGVARTEPEVLHRDFKLHHALAATEKPIIAMVHGPAVGLGASIALACDLVVMATDAWLRDTHVPLGVVAGDGAVVPLVLCAGPAKAKELLLRAATMTGAEAEAAGIINHAWPAGELSERTYALARQIASVPSYAARATKLAVNRTTRWLTDALIEPSLAYEMIAMAQPEHAVAVRRFEDRRRAARAAQE